MLKIVVSKPCSFAGTDFTNQKDAIDKSIAEGHSPITISYFHGVLEDAVGYDIGCCLNGEECADLEKELYKEGIYDCEVIGYPNLCKAFLWNSDRRIRGLIVDSKNEEDLQFAQKKYYDKD